MEGFDVCEQGWHSETQLHNLLEQDNARYQSLNNLLTIQSLTKGLEMLGNKFSVELLFLGETEMPAHDFSRQVYLKLDDVPVIWAESLCDLQSGFWRDYLNCGQQSLGRKLFSGEAIIERTPFTYQMFPQTHQKLMPLIARRSVFNYNDEKLYLTEFYLPELLTFVNGSLDSTNA